MMYCVAGRYDFDSWREFSYHDEENLEKAERYVRELGLRIS